MPKSTLRRARATLNRLVYCPTLEITINKVYAKSDLNVGACVMLFKLLHFAQVAE